MGGHIVQDDPFVPAEGYIKALMHGHMRFMFFFFFSGADVDDMICVEFHPLL